ncbi:MAG: hypothetical protein AAFQ90_05585 [Pseudomonadota bacterium]
MLAKTLAATALVAMLQSSSGLYAAHDAREGWWRIKDDPQDTVRYAQTGIAKEDGRRTIFFYSSPGRSYRAWKNDMADNRIDGPLNLEVYCRQTQGPEYQCYARTVLGENNCSGRWYKDNRILASVRGTGSQRQLVMEDLSPACKLRRTNLFTCATIRCEQYDPRQTIIYSDQFP